MPELRARMRSISRKRRTLSVAAKATTTFPDLAHTLPRHGGSCS